MGKVSKVSIVKLFGATALCAISASLVQAQTPSEVVVLPPIVVVSPTTIPTPEREIASSITVITGEDLTRDQRRTVPDALQAVPGLNVVQTGGPGGQTSIFMRGTNPNHVKVLIDGMDVGDPSSVAGNFDFAHLLAGDIDRIEVLRGPQGGLYGSDAIGGVISITTKKGSGQLKVHTLVEAGSFQTFNQNVNASGAVGNFNYAFNVMHVRSSTPVTPINLLAPGQARINDTYNNWTYSTKLGADLSENLSVTGVVRYVDAKLGFTGDDFTPFPLSFPETLQSTTTNHNLYARGEAVWSLFDGRLKNFFGVSHTDQKNRTINPNPDFPGNFGFTSPLIAPPFTNQGWRTKYDWRGEGTIAPGHVIVVGLEHQKDSLSTDSTGTVDGGFNFTQTTTTASNANKAGYVELQSQFEKRFFIVANIRNDRNESFGPYTTWRIAPVFIVPGTETKLKATYGTGFKAPSLTQLYVDNPSFGFLANRNLKPETSKGYDYGFEQSVLRDRVSFGATYFRNDIVNLIANQFTPVFTNINIGQAKTSGVESFVSVIPVERVKVRADYTYTATRNEVTGLGLFRRPAHKASVAATWNPLDSLSLSATVIYVSSWVDPGRVGTPPRLNTESFTLVNLAANYDVNTFVTVFGRVDNLFNTQYQDPTGFMRPGLGVFGGVRMALDATTFRR
jgi:vitamin B12 transporter